MNFVRSDWSRTQNVKYCSTIWHDDNNTQNIENLLKLQKRAACVITSSDYGIRSYQIFKTLRRQPAKIILDKRDLLMMFKIIKGKAPNYLTMLFSNCNNINYQLRSNNLKISVPKPKSDFLKKSFCLPWSSFLEQTTLRNLTSGR